MSIPDKRIKVAGTLHSVTPSGILASASEIYNEENGAFVDSEIVGDLFIDVIDDISADDLYGIICTKKPTYYRVINNEGNVIGTCQFIANEFDIVVQIVHTSFDLIGGAQSDVYRTYKREADLSAAVEFTPEWEDWYVIFDESDKFTNENRLSKLDEDVEKAKLALFVDMWNTACWGYGSYDPEGAPDTDHPFYLNELYLTYEEAIEIYQLSAGWIGTSSDAGGQNNATNRLFGGVKVRTLIPPFTGNSWEVVHNLCPNSEIETIRLSHTDTIIPYNTPYNTFGACKKLRKVLTVINYLKSPSMFKGCVSLEYVRLAINGDLYLGDSPKLSLDSIQYMVEHSLNADTVVTVTVHPDVYAKLTGDTTNEAVSELTPDELELWEMGLLEASEKNISFATV